MAQISFKKTTKKPADVEWWFKVEPEKSAEMKSFIENYEGASMVEVLTPDPNTFITTFLFDSEEVFGKYMADIHSTQAFISRTIYNQANGITETHSVTTVA